jgi:hypothetical protein
MYWMILFWACPILLLPFFGGGPIKAASCNRVKGIWMSSPVWELTISTLLDAM